MDAEHSSDSVTSSVEKVQSFRIKSCSSQHIDADVFGRFGQHQTGQIDVPFEYQRVMVPLLISWSAKMEGPRHIRSPAYSKLPMSKTRLCLRIMKMDHTEILATGIQQEQTCCVDFGIGFVGWRVMDDSPVGCKSSCNTEEL